MRETFHHPVDVLRFAARATQPYALISVTDIRGGSLRAKGALMAVTEAGEVAGYISNGCVDADIIHQAQGAIAEGEIRSLIYGEGSPYKDIRLPCGGTIHLQVTPNPETAVIETGYEALKNRQAVRLNLPNFEYEYTPKLRLRIAGRGAAVEALALQARQAGCDIHIQSPELELRALEGGFTHLADPAHPPSVIDDRWTAVVLMFHDHDWEGALLTQALAGDAFYIGAMGSERTQAARLELLAELNVAEADRNRIHGPIGLIPTMRDANLLALSTLAEIVKTAQDEGRL